MKMPSSSTVLGLIAFGLVTGLAACSGPNTAWVKSGATADDLRAAQRECSGTASGYSFVDSSYNDEMERTRSSSATGNEYRRCMEGMGWQRERTDQMPKPGQAPK